MDRYKVCLEAGHRADTIKNCEKYDVIAIDYTAYSTADISVMHKRGAKLLAYVNGGMAEKSWSDFDKYKSILIARNEDWYDEYWVDVTAGIWKARIKNEVCAALAKGCDGIWLDNLDVYWYVLEERKDKKKAQAIYLSLIEICKSIKETGAVLILNGADTFVSRLMDEKKESCIDGVNQETVYSRIKDYDYNKGNGKFGEQKSSDHKYFKDYCKRCKRHKLTVYLLEYTKSISLKARIKRFCTKYGMDGYYISKSLLL